MRQLPEGLQAHLDSGATTMAWCWRLTRRDGAVFGFTDHDRPLVFDGMTFEAATGFSASELKEGVGLSIDNLDVSGALRSDTLDENDLAAGLFDDAGVEIFRVNWQDTAQRALMRSGSIGEVRRIGPGFTAEVRGLTHYLQQPRGRAYQAACDADLGDARCGVNLGTSQRSAEGVVVAVRPSRLIEVSGLSALAEGALARGRLLWTGGANFGTRIEIKRHVVWPDAVLLELWQDMARPVAPGDAFLVTVGCDKTFATCRDVFANGVNFRGFPHIPGPDFVTHYPNSDDAGGSGGGLWQEIFH